MPPSSSTTPKPEDHHALVEEIALKHGINPNWAKAIAKTESEFNPRAKSKAGAAGLFQLMPTTQKMFGVKDPYNPRESAEAGVRYLKQLYDMFDGDLEKATAAYNAGPTRVRKQGIPAYPETTGYLRKVLANMQSFTPEVQVAPAIGFGQTLPKLQLPKMGPH